MRALKILTAMMGIAIVVGTLLLVVLIARRTALPNAPAAAALLREPSGTRMIALAPVGRRLAILLQGGGPDRLVLLDPESLQVTARLTLMQNP